MQTESKRAARRGALWTGLALAGGFALAVVAGGLGPSPSTIEATPSQVDDEHDHDEHDHGDGGRHASALGPDGRFTGPGEVWPPQVKGATDIVTLDFAEEAAPTAERAVGVEAAAPMLAEVGGRGLEAALAESRVTGALGDRHVLISINDGEIVPGSSKGDPKATLALFYSHDRGATVEVYLDGATVIEVISRPASEDQPPLGVDEKFRAAELARAHWQEAGDERIDLLEAFVILAVRPGGRYYDSRVGYVSFHVDNESRPELLTWVDLTGETVLDAEVDR